MFGRVKPLDAILATAEKKSLHRTLGAFQLTMLGVGAIIGTGIFVLTAEAAQKAGPGMMISFIIAGFVCAVAALCYAEMASMVPVSGSAYTYSYAVMGEMLAWMVGWALVLEYAVAAGAVAVGWSGYFTGLLREFLGLDMMAAHGAAVVRGSYHAAVVVDMPFGAYEASPQQAFESASRLLKETGCAAVKLEGGAAMAETVAFLTQRGIPVMGHVGLTPQAVNVLGGYNARGRSDAEAQKIVSDAQALDDAGAFAVVVEGVVEPIAIEVTKAIKCPTIGIGASAQCDGQVLVTEDMLGMFERVPRFVKRYENIAETISGAAERYASEVRARTFPGVEQTYQPK